jgi:hypothetical protein
VSPPRRRGRVVRSAVHAGARMAALLLLATVPLAAQQAPGDSAAADPRAGYWVRFGAGVAASLLAHEGAHVATALLVGAHPTFGFSKGRPTVYSGIDATRDPHKQFLFSSMGLDVQAALDEGVLDVPHARGSPFERGVLAGGIGTALFYVTIGRTAAVSDVDYMARTSSLSKTKIACMYGGLALVHALRISRDSRYADFFMRPPEGGGVRLGLRLD